ncbi:MAG: DUF1667 domain-containing protein [Oscillospiraceae bacterium]|nr:DUF1667 domain-containing protein [Oscillospiraceae bacterium]
MKKLICIVCPKGCHLAVDMQKGFAVTGNGCSKGEIYAKQELENPTRTVTGTVKIKGAVHPRCPVKTSGAIPLKLVQKAYAQLDDITLEAPVKTGDVVLKNVCGTGVDFVATRDM